MEAGVVIGRNVRNSFPRHVHDTFCIGIVDRGARLIEHNGKTHKIDQNKAFVINPGIPHKCKPLTERGHDYRVISIKPRVMREFAAPPGERIGNIPRLSQFRITNPSILNGINHFFQCLRADVSTMEKETSLCALLSELVLKHSSSPPTLINPGRQLRAVRYACEYMRSHYARKVSLSRLSGDAGLCLFHFQKVFLKEKGVSPSEYLLKIRMDNAREMLLQGGRLSDISVAVGFSDQSHFTKSFKRAVGITPGRYPQSTGLPESHRKTEFTRDGSQG